MSRALTSPKADPKLAREARDWLVRLSAGGIGAEDLQQFRQWRAQSPEHGRIFDLERSFWQQLDGLAPARAQTDQASAQTRAQTPAQTRTQTRTQSGQRSAPQPAIAVLQPRRALIGRRGFLAGGVAAGAAAWAVDLPHQWQDWQSDLHTGFGEMAGMTLPDGSVATLNTDSAIALGFEDGQRQVTLLRGEAEFRVPDDRGQPLQVMALDGITEARGGVFSVGVEADQARVTVSEGAVRITAAAGHMLELAAAEQAVYGPGRRVAAVGTIDPEIAFAWRQGRIIFDGKRFDAAMEELARYVPERVVMGSRVNHAMPVSAIFSTNAARDAISALALTQGLSVRRVPKVMILVS
ncbi:DUF4880 domain-containing protein [Xinfangfangia sp. D13-10-4-6]|uniref:FecR family protein n=1 Tax=Pseudogemmobacter hezensis TaxID=2737662 RepID=UPI001557615A|nr:FecR domain-containing protein [Pseudogemmobacter hezensis]NPD16360.1 DUF4880 domain-containing protein [Pseudogemmobacter hezensis]